MHNVRFQFRAGSGMRYSLLCEIDKATLYPTVSDISFSTERAVCQQLQKADLEWTGQADQMMFGRWLYVTSKQLQRLGFTHLPLPETRTAAPST
jgi:hypothetical protein